MADASTQPARAGLLKAIYGKLRLLAYTRDFRGALGSLFRAAGMLSTGQFSRLAAKARGPRRTQKPAPVRTGPPLFLSGHIHGHGGYDHVVLKALVGLTAKNVNVFRDPRSWVEMDWVPDDAVPNERMYNFDTPRLAIIPPHLLYMFRPTELTAAWTMWETDTIPAGSAKYLNKCGLVLVPSQWGVDCFRANGVTVPMEMVPLGYDPDVFSPRPANSGPAVCTFGTAGALTEGGLRKNVQRVIDLFVKAFPAGEDVRLKVKITPRSPMVNTHNDPRVEVINTGLKPSELADWYRSLTCYVNASYGEGFGLHLLEAMGCGVPLVSTTFSAVGEVFDSAVGYEVNYKLVEAKNKVYSGRWADPDDEHLIARLREVYADRATADRLGSVAALRAPAFSWAAAIEKLTAALTKHGFLPPSAQLTAGTRSAA
ncbi:glycosyltransferase family 4 protein [Gemmata sp. JC673]|uniref:Glycosyltransferase family 4 protein n=1 Tax=Gemmata algarum TaxID=2975278 RepID=A0ABU5EWU8_9BACT|nr:glycosyltransferase family 4 protein [Gemmata algarum]MDY3559610.1 glycosyltransferase family 4 protein [Gemmata algarum]